MGKAQKVYEFKYPTVFVGQDSSVSIATLYVLDSPGIESRWGRDFPRPALGPTQPPAQWVCFPGVKRSGRGVGHPSHLAPRLQKEKVCTSTTLCAFKACSRDSFTLYLLSHGVRARLHSRQCSYCGPLCQGYPRYVSRVASGLPRALFRPEKAFDS